MPQAWEARLDPKEIAAFRTLYGDARISEKIYADLFRLMLQSKAKGTISCYIASINRWTVFAKKNSYREFPPDPLHFSLYVTDLSERKASFSTFKMIKASFPFYYAMKNSEETCVTKLKFVALAIDGAMRKAAKQRGPVKKAPTFQESDVRDLFQLIFWPKQSTNFPNPSLKDWRTGVRLYCYFKSLCRWDCYSHLTRSSIKFAKDHLVINFPTRKNDKLYEGTNCVMKYKPGDVLCPRLIFQTYFEVMKFKSGDDILNCRLTRNGQTARPGAKLSYGQSLLDSKEIMKRYGIVNFSEKSFKASGVTALLDKKTSLTDVQVYGGWRSEQTPLYYHNSSICRKKEISALLLE